LVVPPRRLPGHLVHVSGGQVASSPRRLRCVVAWGPSVVL